MSKDKIIIYRGTIIIKGEFHSGSGEEYDATDNPLVRDTAGNITLRGESFAGLIRQELVRQFNFQCFDYTDPLIKKNKVCNCKVCSLMGHSRIPENQKKSDVFHASRLKVTGGKFSNAASRIRHGVSVDRRFQVAAQHKKYDVEALLEGASVPFELELEDFADKEIRAMEQILLEMEKGLLCLGGKKSTGFGNYTIKWEKFEFDLTKREGVKNYLLQKFEDNKPSEKTKHVIKKFSEFKNEILDQTKQWNDNKNCKDMVWHGCRLSIPFNLWFPELFLINDPLEAALSGSDHVSVVDGNDNPWLPPSTIRGCFRSRAEQILRTLNYKSACDPARDDGALISCAKGIENKRKNKNNDQWPSYDELEKEDFMCLGCQLFGNTFMASPIRFLSGTYQSGEHHKNILSHFLAVCRFSGGGKDGAKFDALPLFDVRFNDCRIIIENFHTWQAGLIALTLKDFYQSDVRMGFGTRKGVGQAKLEFNDNASVLFSKPGDIYEITVGDIKKNMFEDTQKWLEDCVGTFRTRVKDFKGVTYDG